MPAAPVPLITWVGTIQRPLAIGPGAGTIPGRFVLRTPERISMRFIKELLLAALFTAVFFVVLMVLLPSKTYVERQAEIHHSPVIVADAVRGFKLWPIWTPWGTRDPNAVYSYSDNLYGPGARVDWRSRDQWLGDGSLEIVDQTPDFMRTDYNLVAAFKGEEKRMRLNLRETETGTVNAVIRVDVDYGWDLIGRVHGMYLEAHLGDNLNRSLARLRERIEMLPDADYSVDYAEHRPIAVMKQPMNVLKISGQAATSQPYSIQPTVLRFTDTLTAIIDIQRLTQTGPRVAVLRRWGQNYDFDAAVPIAETEVGDLVEGVTLGTIEGGLFLKTVVRGPRWDLPRHRDMMMAWAGANGYYVRGQFIEEFLNDRTEGDNGIRDADLETNIYLPVQ